MRDQKKSREVTKEYLVDKELGGKRLPEQYDVTIVFRRELTDDFEVALVADKENPRPDGRVRTPVERLVSQLCRELQAAYDEGHLSGCFTVSKFEGPVGEE